MRFIFISSNSTIWSSSVLWYQFHLKSNFQILKFNNEHRDFAVDSSDLKSPGEKFYLICWFELFRTKNPLSSKCCKFFLKVDQFIKRWVLKNYKVYEVLSFGYSQVIRFKSKFCIVKKMLLIESGDAGIFFDSNQLLMYNFVV